MTFEQQLANAVRSALLSVVDTPSLKALSVDPQTASEPCLSALSSSSSSSSSSVSSPPTVPLSPELQKLKDLLSTVIPPELTIGDLVDRTDKMSTACKQAMKRLIHKLSSPSLSSSSLASSLSSAPAQARAASLLYGALDSGTTHVVNVGAASDLDKVINVQLAAGSASAHMNKYDEVIVADGKPLLPMGKVIRRLRLKCEWDETGILLTSKGNSPIELRVTPTLVKDVPYLTREQFETIKAALRKERSYRN